MDLPIEEYFAHANRLSQDEIRLRTGLMEWLPEKIIDAHAHCNLATHVLSISEHARSHMLSTFPYFSLEDSMNLQKRFFPGKTVRSLRFAKTFRGIDHRAANEYLLESSPAGDQIAVFGLPEDVEYTNKLLQHPRAAALKMYWSYVEPPADVIYKFFLPEILEEAQALDVPIILHLPKIIVRSIDDLRTLTKDFPKLRIVLAHLGLSKMVVPGLEEAMRDAARSEYVYMDTALNPSSEVVAMAMRSFGAERIMFGSDEPLNLIRSVAYEHPTKGQRIIPDFRYHWVDSKEFMEYGHLAKKARHSHWQSMLAIQGAVDTLPRRNREVVKQQLFQKTAETVYGF